MRMSANRVCSSSPLIRISFEFASTRRRAGTYLTLNRKDYLAQCLEALVKQTYRDAEIIVVDSGSTDGTWDLVERFPVKLVVQTGRYIGNAEKCRVLSSMRTESEAP